MATMHAAPTHCPVCNAGLTLTRLSCGSCQTTMEGRFSLGGLGRLSKEQMEFVDVFMRCRGKIKDVENALGLSYPTVVARLDAVVAAMEAPPPSPVANDLSAQRQAILDDLAAGRLDAVSAGEKLRALK